MPTALIVTVPHSLLDRFREPPYGAKKLEMSRISWVIPDAKASTFPLLVGTMAMLLVMDVVRKYSVRPLNSLKTRDVRLGKIRPLPGDLNR